MLRVEAANGQRNRCSGRARSRSALLMALGFFLNIGTAWASGPRWVTGPPYFTGSSGKAGGVVSPTQPLYFTDPGDLSASVNHAAADALVAAAAAVWNVPTAAMTMAQGGALEEHVSGANAYLGSNGPVFPAGRAEQQLRGRADRGDLRQRRLGDRYAAGRRVPATRWNAARTG